MVSIKCHCGGWLALAAAAINPDRL